jgi:hypothetical protein
MSFDRNPTCFYLNTGRYVSERRNISLGIKRTEPGVAQWLRHCAASRRVSGSIPGGFGGNFVRGSDGSMWPGVDSASKYEYQELPGGKGGR